MLLHNTLYEKENNKLQNDGNTTKVSQNVVKIIGCNVNCVCNADEINVNWIHNLIVRWISCVGILRVLDINIFNIGIQGIVLLPKDCFHKSCLFILDENPSCMDSGTHSFCCGCVHFNIVWWCICSINFFTYGLTFNNWIMKMNTCNWFYILLFYLIWKIHEDKTL